MRKVIKTAFVTDIRNAGLFFQKQFCSMDHPVFINQFGKGLSGRLFKIPAEGGDRHTYFIGDLLQTDMVLKIIIDMFKNNINFNTVISIN